MSDFDKIINDRLNEDDGEFFPRKEANWDKLSQRLAEFDKANPLPKETPQPVMRPVWRRLVWMSAAAVLVGVSGLLFWHFNEMNGVKQDNARLQQEVVALKHNQESANPETILNRKVIIQNDTIYQTTKTVVTSSDIAKSIENVPVSESNRSSSTPSVFEGKQGDLNKNKQNAAIVENKTNKNNSEIVKNQNPKDAVIQRSQSNQIVNIDNKNAVNAVPFDKKNEPLKEQKAQLNDATVTQIDPSISPSAVETNKADGLGNKQNAVIVSPKTEEGIVKTDRKNIENVETVTQVPPSVSTPILDKKDGLEAAKTDVLALEKTKQDSLTQVRVALQEAKSNEESEQVTPPIIKTDKGLKRWQSFLPKGLAVGVHGTYGSVLPQIQGVKATTGQGLSVELAITKNISVAVTGDFLETHFELRERPKHFRLPDAPDPQKPNVSLHHINGEQKSRMLSVNAKYVVGKEWWIQPFITLGYSWRKIDEHPVNFVYKDFTTGAETPRQATVDTENLKSLWQGGVGFEKKIKRWTFGVSAEIQKDFSNTTDRSGNSIATNFGVLRGGVKFNIF